MVLILFGCFPQFLEENLGFSYRPNACPFLWAMQCDIRSPGPRAAIPLSLLALGDLKDPGTFYLGCAI
jgi:hypothetical protein